MPTSRNAVHSVLFCRDTLLEILGYLSPGWFYWDRSDRDDYLSDIEKDLKPRRLLQKTLASCALTCRAFSDLALAELWKVLDYYVFFLKLLPWTSAGENGLSDVIDLEPNIDEQAWSRFRWYAQFVCKMNTPIPIDVQLSVHRSTWTLLALRLRGEPLFPSLRHLQMPADVEDISPFLFCLSPTIRVFTLEFKRGLRATVQDRDFLLPFLSLISDPSGNPLEHSMCQLITREWNGEEIIQHLRTSARLQTLEDLDLTRIMYSIHHASIAALSRLTSLRTLKTGLLVWERSVIPLFSFTGFASLHHLSLSLLPLSTLSAILTTSGLRTTPLRSIDLHCDVSTDDNNNMPLPIAELQHHLALIRAALPDNLEDLHLWFLYNTRAEPPLPLSTLLAPFLSLVHLKNFDLCVRRGYVPHILDSDLRALASAWPHLEVLFIWVRELRDPAFSTARPPTVAGLVELAKGCSRLRRVTLPALDVFALPKASTLPREGHEGVRFLDMCALVKGDGVAVEDVARVLDRLFPCLEDFYSIGGTGVPQAKSWHEVQSAMRGIQAARSGIGRQ